MKDNCSISIDSSNISEQSTHYTYDAASNMIQTLMTSEDGSIISELQYAYDFKKTIGTTSISASVWEYEHENEAIKRTAFSQHLLTVIDYQ